MNITERWFGTITRQRVFCSVAEHVHTIKKYIVSDNAELITFACPKSAGRILNEPARAKAALQSSSTA
jgi:hypothetical protein